MKSTDIQAFFRELHLLIKSGLPLPEGILEISRSINRGPFKEAVEDIGRRTSDGETITDVMASYPHYFSKYHIRLIGMGLVNNTLADVLLEIVKHGEAEYKLFRKLKISLLAPMFVVYTALCVNLYALAMIVPAFATMFKEMLGSEPLPPVTQFIIFLSKISQPILPVALIIMLFLPILLLWLYGGGHVANRVFIQILTLIPGYSQITNLADYSRFCGVLSVFIKNHIPMTHTLQQASRAVRQKTFQKQIEDWITCLENGSQFQEVLEAERTVDPTLKLAVVHAPENELPDVMADMAQYYEEKAEALRQNLTSAIAFIVTACSVVIAGLTVMGLFTPLVRLIDQLGG